MINIEVKHFELSMLDECVDLFMNTFSKEPWYDKYDSRNQVVDFFINYTKNNYFLGYVALKDEKIVGLSIGSIKPWLNGMEYYIDQFCIDYDLQHCGLGTTFMNYIEKDLKAQNLNAIFLLTDEGFPSYNFYKKAGFSDLKGTVSLGKNI